MYMSSGQPSAIAFKSIGQSKRWNRQPIPTGSSDYDSRAGGGVSLTAASDSSEKVIVSSRQGTTNKTIKEAVKPASNLRGDAKPFTTQAAASILMDMYLKGSQRTRSATSVQPERTNDETNGHGISTVHSSPIKPVAQNHTMETAPGLNGVEKQHIQTPIYSIPTLPMIENQPISREPVSITRAGIEQYHQPHSINYNTEVSTSKPNTEVNTALGYQRQVFANHNTPALTGALPTLGPGQNHHGGATATGMQVGPPALGHYYEQNHGQGLPHGHPGMGGNQQVGYDAYDTLQRHSEAPPCLRGIEGSPMKIQAQDRVHEYPVVACDRADPRGHLDDFGGAWNGKHPLALNTHNQLEAKPRAGMHGDYSHLGMPSYASAGVLPRLPVHGESSPEPKMQNGSSAIVNGYKVGLPGSVSDGNIFRYHSNEQASTSMALMRVGHETMDNQFTIGPMDFEMPSKDIMANRSEMLQTLTQKGQPSAQDILDTRFLPFTEGYKYSFPSEENGVIVIRNIPYETTRGEVVALLGKSSKILNDRQEPVHIIMDRVSSKTQDVFCELSNLNAAIELVDRFKKGPDNGRIGRLGSRIVEVELSSQTNLMATLFPSSRHGVNWRGNRPNIVTDSAYPWENFKGFFTEEEMVMLCKHVENPQRSLYARICPERPYECMISTLRKIPWYMAEHITIKQRHSVYDACMKMITVLSAKIKRSGGEDNTEAKRLTPQLLDRLVASAMLCAGFSVVQKHNIATVAGLPKVKSREFNQPRFPDSWRHQWTLVPKAGMPIDVLEWYIAVIRAETTRVVQSLEISQRMPLCNMMEHIDGYWGFFWAEANFPVGRVWDNMSLAECSRLEWRAIERIITRAIRGGNVPPSYTTRSYHLNSGVTRPARLTYGGC
ncbi:hypothetical protein ONZ43_g4307 [Nemania bipapillata]|uniref:Uncharacterized protein n=1 Tax=Nemania bipapillata TaxID=110536 RepID=A0ACC2IPE1_9PEZI|nr:hypothetical protein ONZ43_g4307 [Nemania bipapillata]